MNIEEEMIYLQKHIEQKEIEDKEEEFHNFINLQVIDKIDSYHTNPYYLWNSYKVRKKKDIILYKDTIPDFIDEPKKFKKSRKNNKKSTKIF